MYDKIFLICLGVFLLLYGLANVTNVSIVWMAPLTGLAALVAGVIALIRALQ